MPRLSGQVRPYIPSTAPMPYRLSQEVYSLDGFDAQRHTPMIIMGGGILLAAYLLLRKK